MNKKVGFKKALAVIIITNIVTASVMAFAPIPLVGGKRIVSNYEYGFINQFKKMLYIKSLVETNYVDKVKLDESKMVDSAISGMVSSIGDPYTVYLDKDAYRELTTTTQGSYAGLGIYLGEKDNRIVVIAPIEDTPAEKAGIKSGDSIIKVENTSVTSKDMDKAVNMMRGKEGTKINITIYREGVGNLNFTLTRAVVKLKTVKGEMLDGKIGYIRITTFDENTADAFNEALDSLTKQGMKGLMIDLRDNPGGLLDTSTSIANKLLGKGTIVYTIDNQNEKEVWSSDADKINVPLVLLVNGGSASASEILSGAVRDFKAGTLIGTKTFGKGLVQNVIDLKDGTGLKVTIARYYTPSGECIQGKGITPDIVVELPKAAEERQLTRQEDTQFQKGIEVIKSKIK